MEDQLVGLTIQASFRLRAERAGDENVDSFLMGIVNALHGYLETIELENVEVELVDVNSEPYEED